MLAIVYQDLSVNDVYFLSLNDNWVCNLIVMGFSFLIVILNSLYYKSNNNLHKDNINIQRISVNKKINEPTMNLQILTIIYFRKQNFLFQAFE